jgi:hypothetical protein
MKAAQPSRRAPATIRRRNYPRIDIHAHIELPRVRELVRLIRARRNVLIYKPHLILRACESVDFRDFRHKKNQWVATREAAEKPIDSQTLRSVRRTRLELPASISVDKMRADQTEILS